MVVSSSFLKESTKDGSNSNKGALGLRKRRGREGMLLEKRLSGVEKRKTVLFINFLWQPGLCPTSRLSSKYASFVPHAVLYYCIFPDYNHHCHALHTKQPNSSGFSAGLLP